MINALICYNIHLAVSFLQNVGHGSYKEVLWEVGCQTRSQVWNFRGCSLTESGLFRSLFRKKWTFSRAHFGHLIRTYRPAN